MERWSESGGERVPAVVAVSARVVSVTSMREAELWTSSYLVGVVMVVKRSFSMRKLWKWWVWFSRLMLRSPWMVMEVWGCLSSMSFMVCCRSSVNTPYEGSGLL